MDIKEKEPFDMDSEDIRMAFDAADNLRRDSVILEKKIRDIVEGKAKKSGWSAISALANAQLDVNIIKGCFGITIDSEEDDCDG